MDLTDEEKRFLEIVSGGGRITYVHIVKGFGMMLTPMAPTFTNRIAQRLLGSGLVKRTGLLRDSFAITEKGREALQTGKFQ